MIRLFAAALFVCVFSAPLSAHAQCAGLYDDMVTEARATRESLDAMERYAPANGTARATSSLVVRVRAMSRTLDEVVLYAERADFRGDWDSRDGYWSNDWLAYVTQLRSDLDAVMPELHVSNPLTVETRAELRRIAVAISVTRRGGCRH